MSAEDWIFGVFVMPLFITGLWIVLFKVWRTGYDVSGAVSWFTGEQGLPGYYAFLGPGVIAMTTGWIGAIATLFQQGMESPPAGMDAFIGVSFGICVFSLLLGCWLWAFRWPGFLVPPHHRRHGS